MFNLKGLLTEEDANICFNIFKCYKNSRNPRNALNLLVLSNDKEIRKKYELQAKALNLRVININDKYEKLEILGSQIIIGSSQAIKEIEDYLPMDIEIIIGDNNLIKFNRRQNSWKSNFKKDYKLNEENLTWESELAWRLIRDFELRKSPDETKDIYQEDINALIPHWETRINLFEKQGNSNNLKQKALKKSIIERIDSIQRILFPSIIECLIEGIKKHPKQYKLTTLSEGFKEEDKRIRYVLLKHQYRMHPEISKFPRKYIYKNNALLDSTLINREWPFEHFFNKKRAIWINVLGKMDNSRKNEKEARILIKFLKKFINYTKKHPKNNKKSWELAILTFYRAQEKFLRKLLQDLFHTKKIRFFNKNEWNLSVELCTVDRFQGHEADIIFLSMVQTEKEGFLNSINRLNVAITRARYQLVIFGTLNNFQNPKRTRILRDLTENLTKIYNFE